ncbi:CehA/McbA family metallohydrolase [Paenibacillus solisilvae]|uniref:CehA/McbA family metallohydrolase n=1 Tax=Paenibacillus solisilvae TaxID=2486751 RepID=A0ABW0WAR7_9BACL
MKDNSQNESAPRTLISFRIDQPADWLVVHFHYERAHTWRTLNLLDPAGRIRLSHLDCYNSRTVIVHRSPVYSSYLTVPGSIPAGEWKIEFADQSDPAEEVFKFEWEAGSGDLPSGIETAASDRQCWTGSTGDQAHYGLHQYDWQAVREEAARWYKGDFHTHTVLSDGKMTPERNMEQAEIMGLDFFVATDHNLLSTSWPAGKVLVIPGIEFTSEYGHWNALGLKQWIDWRYRAPDGGIGTQEGMNRVMEEARRHGALRSINHPMLTPWAWMYELTPLAMLDALEIWNDPTYHSNPAATEKALALWSTLWNEGYRVTGIGGSDSHMLPTESYGDNNPPSLIGDPATYVHAERLSAAAILEGVRAGRVYVSRGPVLDLAVTVDDKAYPLGSDLTEPVQRSKEGRVHCRLTVSNASEGSLHVIENGKEIEAYAISDTAQTFEIAMDWKEAQYVWRRIELRSMNGELLAFTNPVSYGSKEQEITTWKQLLDRASFEVPVN